MILIKKQVITKNNYLKILEKEIFKMNALSKEQILQHYQDKSPKDLVAMFEGLRAKLWDLADIKENPAAMFKPETIGMVTDMVMENYSSVIEGIDYGDDTQVMESYVEGQSDTAIPVNQVHVQNLRQLLENSAAEIRTAAPNQFNMNQLTPFDAFLPFTIIRSYLPLVAKDLMPTQTPPKPFIRIKKMYKYIVTKDGSRHLRPDVFMDSKAAKAILDTAKGPRVTTEWFPKATEVAEGTTADITVDGVGYTLPEKVNVAGINVLTESGGLLAVGDALDIDVCVDGIRAVVKASDGTETVVEQTGYKAYPDLTSISPQRSVSFDVKIPVKNAAGEVETYVYDRVMGSFNASTNTFDLASLHGYVRQVQFDGHLSNKNNSEYISFTNEYGVTQHPIAEGYTSNVPITQEDMQLFNETASIDIVATAMAEMSEIFTQLEDNETIFKIDEEKARWEGVSADEHPFEHMFGPVVITKEITIQHDVTGLKKRFETVQDEINYALRDLIGKARNVLKAEPFRVVAFCHPNVASLFVGNNVDWKIEAGSTAGMQGIRSDYKMGVYTSDGNSFRLATSQKFEEADGLRFLIFPVNEQNFLSWKHFKYSMFFSREYRNPQMQLVPNVQGKSRFETHAYTPLQMQLLVKGY